MLWRKQKSFFFEKKTPRDSPVTARGESRFLLRSFSGTYLLSPRLLRVMLSSITYF